MPIRVRHAPTVYPNPWAGPPTQRHFAVFVPVHPTATIAISERHGRITPDTQIRVVLTRTTWNSIAAAVQDDFNARMYPPRPGSWTFGWNLLCCDRGKELLLLAWAIAYADLDLVPVALRNWQALPREERWWLYTQTAVSLGSAWPPTLP